MYEYDSDLERRVKIKLIIDGLKQIDLARQWGVSRQAVNSVIMQRCKSKRLRGLLYEYLGTSNESKNR